MSEIVVDGDKIIKDIAGESNISAYDCSWGDFQIRIMEPGKKEIIIRFSKRTDNQDGAKIFLRKMKKAINNAADLCGG